MEASPLLIATAFPLGPFPCVLFSASIAALNNFKALASCL
jgi:hypothetical protein